jgi:hypothetical protein
MRIKVKLSIGFPTACRRETLDIPDEELEGMSPDEQESYLMEYVQEWANNYIDYGYDVVE